MGIHFEMLSLHFFYTTLSWRSLQTSSLLEHWRGCTGPSRPKPHPAKLGGGRRQKNKREKKNKMGRICCPFKAFQAWHRSERRLVLKFSGNCHKREMWIRQIFKLKVDKDNGAHFISYLLNSEQPSACFMKLLKRVSHFGDREVYRK